MSTLFKQFLFLPILLSAARCGQQAPAKPEAQAEVLAPAQQAMLEMEKAWKPAFDISVDTTIFNHHRMGVYTSDKYDTAAISVVIFPVEDFAAEKAKFKAREAKENEQEKFKGIVSVGDREMLVTKSLVKEESLELAVHQYQIMGDAQRMIIVSCACKPEHETELDKVFENAVKSVRLKQ